MAAVSSPLLILLPVVLLLKREHPISDKQGNITVTISVPGKHCDYSKFHSAHSMVLEAKPECNPSRENVTEKEKKEILALHNTLRAKVAKGAEHGGDPGPQPRAANMAVLHWNDELAHVAQAWANQCHFGYDGATKRKMCSRHYVVGQNVYHHTGDDHSMDWSVAVHRWYSEVDHMPGTLVHAYPGNDTSRRLHSYAQVVWALTREVGCGSATFNRHKSRVSRVYVCNYGPSGNMVGVPVYLQGPTATECGSGTPSKHYPDLCGRGAREAS